MTPPAQLKFVEIEWIDSVSENRWNRLEKLPVPVQCVSRGWLVVDTLTYITIAATIQLNNDQDFGEILTVPRSMIKAYREIELEEGPLDESFHTDDPP